jgi:transposase-like protein
MASGAAIGAIGVSEAPGEKKVWNHGTTPSLSGETGDCAGFSSRWNSPQRRGTRPHAEQLQLDELYAVLRDLKAGEISHDEAIRRLERSPYWVWTVIDPTSKLLVVVDVGAHTLAMAQRVVHQLVEVLAPGCVPLFVTDGFKEYGMAILAHFGHWMQPERRQAKGGFVANLHLRRFVLWSLPVTSGAQRGRTTMAISFKGAHFPQDIILMGIRWYVAYPLSYRHVEELMQERGVPVDHATIQHWVVKYSPLLEAAFHRRKRSVWLSWRMDETYINQWCLSLL